MKSVKMWMLAMQIERKWKRINENRKRMEVLVNSGEPYTSPELVNLDEKNAALGFEAGKLEKEYRKMTVTQIA